MVYWWVSVAALVVLACPPGFAQSGAAGLDLRGGWQAELYTLKTGERHVVKGLIVFTATEWSVTFFVTVRVLVSAMVPLQQKRTCPPMAMA